MANDEAEHNAARMLGCEISDDPLNPLLPIMQACRNHHPDEDLSILERAYRRAVIQHSSQRRKSGEPYIIHPLAVAQILADLGMGPLVVAAGLLHDTVEDTSYTLTQLSKDFGEEIAQLVDGVTSWLNRRQLTLQQTRGMLAVPVDADAAEYARSGYVSGLERAKRTYAQ